MLLWLSPFYIRKCISSVMLSHPVSHVGQGQQKQHSSWSLKEFSPLFYGRNDLFGRAAFQEAGYWSTEEWVMVNDAAFKQFHLYIVKQTSSSPFLGNTVRVMSLLLRCSVHCDSAWTTLQPHREGTKHVWDKAIKQVSAGQHCMPCTMLGTVRYITEVNNLTLFLRSPQQSNCQMTPTEKESEHRGWQWGQGRERLTDAVTGESKGRHREADHVPGDAAYSWLSCKEV